MIISNQKPLFVPSFFGRAEYGPIASGYLHGPHLPGTSFNNLFSDATSAVAYHHHSHHMHFPSSLRDTFSVQRLGISNSAFTPTINEKQLNSIGLLSPKFHKFDTHAVTSQKTRCPMSPIKNTAAYHDTFHSQELSKISIGVKSGHYKSPKKETKCGEKEVKELLSPRSSDSSSHSCSVSVKNICLDKKHYTCPQCKYTTDRKNNLKRHISTMHQDTTKVLECCSLVFRSKASLRDHVALFHKAGYRCQFCGRNFCRKALLRRHLTVHSGQKDYLCSLCGYATSHKSNLERHRKIHERRSPVKVPKSATFSADERANTDCIDDIGGQKCENVCNVQADREIKNNKFFGRFALKRSSELTITSATGDSYDKERDSSVRKRAKKGLFQDRIRQTHVFSDPSDSITFNGISLFREHATSSLHSQAQREPLTVHKHTSHLNENSPLARGADVACLNTEAGQSTDHFGDCIPGLTPAFLLSNNVTVSSDIPLSVGIGDNETHKEGCANRNDEMEMEPNIDGQVQTSDQTSPRATNHITIISNDVTTGSDLASNVSEELLIDANYKQTTTDTKREFTGSVTSVRLTNHRRLFLLPYKCADCARMFSSQEEFGRHGHRCSAAPGDVAVSLSRPMTLIAKQNGVKSTSD